MSNASDYKVGRLEEDLNEIKTLLRRVIDGEVGHIKVLEQRVCVLDSEVARLRAVDHNKSFHSWIMLGATILACGCTVLGTLWNVFR